MPQDSNAQRTWITAGVAALLLLVLHLHLLGALLSAAATFEIYRRMLVRLRRRMPRYAGLGALVVTLGFIAAIVLMAVVAVRELWTPRGGLPGLLELLADTLARLRDTLPPWIAQRLPESTGDLQAQAAGWLRGNAQQLQHWGREALRIVAHLLIGFAIGLLCALQNGPALQFSWAPQLREALEDFAASFADIVAAQGRISFVNTIFTGVFLLALMPAFGVHLPLAMTLVVFTFFGGLLPIVGNIASNTAIVLVALTQSLGAAVAALVFLVGIHKLEYFLNAHIVGHRTRVPAAVLLGAMLVLEAAFGIPGLIAAPVYAAWLIRRTTAPAPTRA